MPTDLSLLTPLALAHWIMQDGGKSSSGGLYLCTDLFNPEDIIRLAKYLQDTYQLKVTTPAKASTWYKWNFKNIR